MNRIIKYIIACPALLMMLGGCNEQEAALYSDEPKISFTRGDNGYGQQDSVTQSFFLLPSDQLRDTVWVELSLEGTSSATPRTIKIEQTNIGKAGAAEAGKHYVAFDDPSLKEAMQLPANAVSVNIPVILLLDNSLYNEKVAIEMTVAENENFKPGIEENRNFKVTTTAMAEEPSTWSTWQYYFGEWGSVKMKFIIDYVGFSNFEESPETAYRSYLQSKAIKQLEEYNATHDQPLCEDVDYVHADGERCPNCVEFPL